MRLTKIAVLNSTFLLGGLLATVVPACASLVTYTTSGSFTESGTNVFTDGSTGSTLTFNDDLAPGVSVDQPGSTTLGTFTPDIMSDGLTASGDFDLVIEQSVPGAGLGDYDSANFTGTFTYDAGVGGGTTYLTFTGNTSVTIDGITYALEGLTSVAGGEQLSIASSGPATSLEAYVTPEPGLYGMTGLGLLGMFAWMAKRRKNRLV